jgi:hypothetical protein
MYTKDNSYKHGLIDTNNVGYLKYFKANFNTSFFTFDEK